ncbi:hypothetical protein GPM19_10360 [Halomonas sp. ZH2S]|uniref:Uncharacterized protein n=1 Tax=Vreelandella zhuhanensis TaxID=2684210 RepID=A0A7X3KR76_9GAMM|nr:hypothetical protein [Halomonas zhuhanensis]MWJ28603.1 hypothetical protein [Halomonas zhuhanensis]
MADRAVFSIRFSRLLPLRVDVDVDVDVEEEEQEAFSYGSALALDWARSLAVRPLPNRFVRFGISSIG